ncbi:hypothetical protein VULLAG_LOCUS19885 [Vulpes lagopus]
MHEFFSTREGISEGMHARILLPEREKWPFVPPLPATITVDSQQCLNQETRGNPLGPFTDDEIASEKPRQGSAAGAHPAVRLIRAVSPAALRAPRVLALAGSYKPWARCQG